MTWSNGDGGMNSNAAGRPVVGSQPRNVLDRPVAPTTWA